MLKQNDHIRKWKYYTLGNAASRHAGSEATSRKNLSKSSGVKVGTVFAVLVVIASAMLYISIAGTGTKTAGSLIYLPISITDPPEVPAGTSALYINYSSVEILAMVNGTAQNIPINASGRLDLMGLVNESQVLGAVALKQHESIESITFSLESASIVMDNSTYPVQLQNSQVTADLGGRGGFNSTSGILLDFMPLVVPVYANGILTFQMFSSMQAAVVPNPNAFNPGSRIFINVRQPVPTQVQQMLPFGNAKIEIASADLTLLPDNSIALSVSLMSNATANTTIFGVMVSNRTIAPTAGLPVPDSVSIIQSSDGSITSIMGSGAVNAINGSFVTAMPGGFQTARAWGMPVPSQLFFNQSGPNVTINASDFYRQLPLLNVSANGSVTIRLSRPVSNITISGLGGLAETKQAFAIGFASGYAVPSLIFYALSNGTLAQAPKIAQDSDKPIYIRSLGYSLPRMANATLSYNGPMPENYYVFPLNFTSGNYTVTVLTSAGMVQRNFT